MKGKAKTSENIKIKDLKDLLDQKNEELNQKNRELKIESALEKVRSASMSMQQSNELQKVVSVIFEQLQDLNFALDGAAAFIMTDVEDFNGVELWMEDKVTHPVRFRLPYYDAPSINDIYSARKKGKEFEIKIYGKEKNIWFDYAFVQTDLKIVPEDRKKWILAQAYLTQAFAIQKNSMIGIHAHHKKTLKDNEIDILKKFSRVFEQGYVRFLDLKKAEEQAREAQIEVALERVRSHSIGMQKSEELQKIIQVIFEQFKQLGFNIDSAGFATDYMESDDFNIWFADANSEYPNKIHIPYFDHPQFNRFREAKEKGLDFYTSNLTFEEKNKLFDHIFKISLQVPKELKDMAYSSAGYMSSHVFLKNVVLYILNYSSTPFSEEENAILKRFARIFEQAYARFLDLQKAEAQAREAQIETALERVRSRTMAMHKSDELKEVIQVINNELVHLGFEITNSGITLDIRESNDFNLWMADSRGEFPFKVRIPYFEHPLFAAYKEAKEKNLNFYTKTLSFEEKNQYHQYVFELEDIKNSVTEEQKQITYRSPGFAISTALLKQVGIYALNLAGIPYTDAENLILMRFGKVFEQTYTRFLDLQKAEAQAREAQIEASLERVRSKAMTMHNSADLSSAASIVFTELRKLGVNPIRSGVGLFNKESRRVQLYSATSSESGDSLSLVGWVQLEKHPVLERIYEAWLNQEDYFPEMQGEELRSYYKSLLTGLSVPVPEFKNDEKQFGHFITSSIGCLYAWSIEGFNEDQLNIFKRFASIIDLTFRRFLELQKAEAQAREAQIEAALERIRARSMAMHSSNELKDVIRLLYKEFRPLITDFTAVNIQLNMDTSRDLYFWAEVNEDIYEHLYHWPASDLPLFDKAEEAWKSKDGFLNLILNREEKDAFFNEVYKIQNVPENRRKMIQDIEGMNLMGWFQKYSGIDLLRYDVKPFNKEEIQIVKRFSEVFEQTYIRFLDMQKAEAHAREAQIEAALEKVRATAMAMHESSELNKVIREVSQQLSLLGFVFDISNIGTDISPEGFYIWNASPSQSIISGVYVPYKELDFVNWFYSNKEKTDAPVSARFTKTQKNAFFRHYFTKTEGKNLSPERKKYVLDGQSLDISTVHKKEFTLNVFNYRGIVYSDEQNHILYRFANVFEQAYARFLDLKKAEAQAREAQIEAALERVRARTMGMHKSIELHDVIKVISEQIIALGVKFDHTTFIQFNHDKSIEVWVTTPEQPYPAQIHVPFINHRFFNVQSEMTKIKSDFLAEIYDKEEKNRFFNHFFKNTIASNIPKNRQNYVLQAPGMARHTFRVSTIYFSIANYECIPYTDEENKVLRRFANVFKQSYTRFLDLQKAEAQAREAKIEASLERVRAKAMAMHKSDEVQEVVHAMFEEMAELGVDMGSAVVTSELDEEYPEKGVNMWVATDEDIYFKKIYLPYFDHPVWDNIIHNLKKKKNFYTEVFNKKIKDDFFSYLYKHTDLKYAPEERKKMIFKSPGMSRANVVNKNAGLYVMKFKDQPFSDEENKIVQRFGKVFEQTFTRFLDLQRAEKQAREAVKQASLDRVRAEIASMRNAEDLNRITPVIWRELKTFEVPFIRCGVFIIDEKTEKVQVYLTTPEGAALAVLNLKIGENRITKDTVDFWRKRQVYKEHWNKEEFINWTKSMMKTGQVQSAEKYQGSATAPESLDLHFIPFKQGMLYVGNTNPLSDEELNLVDSLAKTFSIAYARYEDFKKLEEAKNKIELTLNELKAAQSQLIQSEKMASLGELTAGIAHEIQNPLNFVNNFSEINSELIEEQKKELENENSKEAKILANEIGENEKKIIHHGKRAESIVKGMLLHSRQSSGKKELVDVNMLADEYLRLAYHGFRAKDESFNADFKLEADESLPKIEVVPQDFGRVLLNLINNAFYAVNKRAKEPTPHPPEGGLRNSHTEYKPQVTVITASSKSPLGDLGVKEMWVKVTVKDNGPGIPASIKDKIFQPFFTTKSTGEGTGLGLSLSYDIVKAHEGEIKIETSENKGSEFIIQLPLKM